MQLWHIKCICASIKVMLASMGFQLDSELDHTYTHNNLKQFTLHQCFHGDFSKSHQASSPLECRMQLDSKWVPHGKCLWVLIPLVIQIVCYEFTLQVMKRQMSAKVICKVKCAKIFSWCNGYRSKLVHITLIQWSNNCKLATH